jgi:uncharacterized membrane protein
MEENVSNEVVSVRSVGMKFGLIMAVYSIVFFLVLTLADLNAFDNKWGWVNMVVSIVVLVLAHRNFKSSGDSFMSYGQGIGIAFWISLTSVVVGALFTYLYAEVIAPETMEKFYDFQREQMESKNMQDEQIEVGLSWVKKLFWPMYVFFGMFFGILIALIVTIFTQKKNPDPTQYS